jgi:hypothetical protein
MDTYRVSSEQKPGCVRNCIYMQVYKIRMCVHVCVYTYVSVSRMKPRMCVNASRRLDGLADTHSKKKRYVCQSAKRLDYHGLSIVLTEKYHLSISTLPPSEARLLAELRVVENDKRNFVSTHEDQTPTVLSGPITCQSAKRLDYHGLPILLTEKFHLSISTISMHATITSVCMRVHAFLYGVRTCMHVCLVLSVCVL